MMRSTPSLKRWPGTGQRCRAGALAATCCAAAAAVAYRSSRTCRHPCCCRTASPAAANATAPLGPLLAATTPTTLTLHSYYTSYITLHGYFTQCTNPTRLLHTLQVQVMSALEQKDEAAAKMDSITKLTVQASSRDKSVQACCTAVPGAVGCYLSL